MHQKHFLQKDLQQTRYQGDIFIEHTKRMTIYCITLPH